MFKRIIIILFVFLISDIYFYQAVLTLSAANWIRIGYWALDLLLIVGLITLVFLGRLQHKIQQLIQIVVTTLLLVFTPKIISFPLLFVEDITRIFRGFPTRNIYVSEITVLLAFLIFLVVVFGLTRGKHFYKLRKETLYFDDLPEAFDGFTITQISDIHSGSLSDSKGVQKGIDLANDQHSDLL